MSKKERKTYVYKITRVDGLSYIGITVNPKKRFRSHSKSNRFSLGIEKIEILDVCENYEQAEDLEEEYISLFDTFKNGLNMTKNGRGRNKDGSFSTLGHIYSEKSKRKMSISAKKRGPTTIGYKHTSSSKKKMSDIRKGKSWGPRKIPIEDNIKIYEEYKNDKIIFENEFIKKYIKKTQRNDIDNLDFSDLRAPNGKPLNKKILYGYYYANIYGVSPVAIRKIIENEGETSPDYDTK